MPERLIKWSPLFCNIWDRAGSFWIRSGDHMGVIVHPPPSGWKGPLSSEGFVSLETSGCFLQKYTHTRKNGHLLGYNGREFLTLPVEPLGQRSEAFRFLKHLPEARRKEMGVPSCLLGAARISGICKGTGNPLPFLAGFPRICLESAQCKPC